MASTAKPTAMTMARAVTPLACSNWDTQTSRNCLPIQHGGKRSVQMVEPGQLFGQPGPGPADRDAELATLLGRSSRIGTAPRGFIKRGDLDKIFAARAARLAAMKAPATVAPGTQRVNDQFLAANESRAMLDRSRSSFQQRSTRTFRRRMSGLTCVQAGIASHDAVLERRFRWHSQHANGYASALPRLTNLVSYIWDKAADLGIANRIYVRDFLRVRSYAAQQFQRQGPLWTRRLPDNHEGRRSLGQPCVWLKRTATPIGADRPEHRRARSCQRFGDAAPAHSRSAMRKYLGIQTRTRSSICGCRPTRTSTSSEPVNTGYLYM
jgi:hypothetical protein